jgi:hypothetical protein
MQPKQPANNIESKSTTIFEKLKIDIFVISKKQNIILNHIPPKTTVVTKMQRELKKKFSFEQDQLIKNWALNNDSVLQKIGSIQDQENLKLAIKK